jgi:hypothetical protein
MSETPRAAIRSLETGVAALLLAFTVLGLSLLPVASKPVVAGLVRAVDSHVSADLTGRETLDAAEGVRRFVVDPDAPGLPATIAGRPAFDASSVSHLEDVRDVLVPALRLSAGLGVALAVWALVRRRSAAGRRLVASACRAAGLVLLASAFAGIAAAALDFDGFFGWFHTLFFAEGTWVFPAEALLVRLFPIPFWVAAGSAWGAIVLACAIVLIRAERRSCFTE